MRVKLGDIASIKHGFAFPGESVFKKISVSFILEKCPGIMF